MKVLHVLCDLSSGGAERLVLELCRRRGPDIEVAVATVGGLGPLEGAFRAAGVPLIVGGRPRKHLGLRAMARLTRAMDGVDIVHTHLFAGDTWGRLAAVLARVGNGRGPSRRPIVVTTEHNVNRDETWQRTVKRALAPVSDAIVCVSEAAAAYTRDVEGIAGARVIPNGIDLSRFGPHRGSNSGDPTRVLAIGRRVPQKGFDVLVAALPEGMRLDIVGEGPYRVDHPRVRFLGLREDVPELLAGADILAVPSRWEGFGLAAAEGLAAGVAVVASDVDGLREVVGDAGLLVPPGEVAPLEGALRRLGADPVLRRALGERGRVRVAARFDIRQTTDRYERLYLELALGCSTHEAMP
ncbi:MAG: glycosyltransferase [Pseudomonadota bacterium]|nr:glycosyltransferase [Pseudomonadota bacterium]